MTAIVLLLLALSGAAQNGQNMASPTWGFAYESDHEVIVTDGLTYSYAAFEDGRYFVEVGSNDPH